MISTEKLFDKSANSYEKTEEIRFKEYTRKTLDKTINYLQKDDIVLDFGCATGTKALELTKYVQKIEAIDISSKMIEVAKSKVGEGNMKNVNFTKASIFDEQFKNESFNVILAFNVLHLLEDSRFELQRIIELLKPGGLFISTTPCLREKMTFSMRYKFSFFLLLIKIGLFPVIRRYKFSELDDLIGAKNLKIIESEKSYDQLSGYFVVGRKI